MTARRGEARRRPYNARLDQLVFELRHRGWRAAASVLRRRTLDAVGAAVMRRAYPRVSWGPRVRLAGPLRIVGFGAVEIGADVAVLNANGERTILSTVTPHARIVLSPGVRLNGTSVVAAELVEVGPRAMLGPCIVMDSDFHSTAVVGREARDDAATAPVRIGAGVWVGAGAQILRGVTIGDHAVIGAGSVVRTDVPAGVIVVGNPQRIVGRVDAGVTGTDAEAAT